MSIYVIYKYIINLNGMLNIHDNGYMIELPVMKIELSMANIINI